MSLAVCIRSIDWLYNNTTQLAKLSFNNSIGCTHSWRFSTFYEGYIVSVQRMVMKNRPVDPGGIQGSHRPISLSNIFVFCSPGIRSQLYVVHQFAFELSLILFLHIFLTSWAYWLYHNITQLAKLSFNHSIGCTQSWRFLTFYEGFIVSVQRMVMKNRPVDPGSIQGSHRPISFIRIIHRTRANDFL